VRKIAQGGALVLLMLCCFSATRIAQRDWHEITPYDNSFSFRVPEKVAPQRKEGNHYGLHFETISYSTTVQGAGHIFIAIRTRFHDHAKLAPAKEMQETAERFVARLKGKIAKQKEFNWTRGEGDVMPALEVTAEVSYGTFRNIYVMDGRYLFEMIAGPAKPENAADIDRFFASLKIPKR